MIELLGIFIFSITFASAIGIYLYKICYIKYDDFYLCIFFFVIPILFLSLCEYFVFKIINRSRKKSNINSIFILIIALFLQILFFQGSILIQRISLINTLIFDRFYLLSFIIVAVIAIVVSFVISRVLYWFVIKKIKKYLKNQTKFKRYSALFILIALIISVFFVFESKNTVLDSKNVVVITVDSLRYDYLSYVDEKVITPNIATLSEKGIIFNQFYVHAPYTWTSLSSMMTSLESPFHQVRKNGIVLDDVYLTLAEVLRDNGYECYVPGDLDFRILGLHQGFNNLPRLKDMFIDGLYGIILALHRLFPDFFGKYCIDYRGNNSVRTTIKALEFLRANREKKFFLWIHYYNEPHLPYFAPSYYSDIYNKNKKSWVDGSYEILAALNGNPEYKEIISDRNFTADDITFLKNLYRAEITAVDVQVGMILDYLKKSGLFNNTLIVLTSDHGQDFGERGHFIHSNNLFNTLIKVPLIIHLPDEVQSKRISSLSRGIDIAPTILQYIGIEIPNYYHGSSLLPLLINDIDEQINNRWCYSETLVFGYDWPYERFGFSYTSGKYKYICQPDMNKEELYDIESDPHETYNIAGANKELISVIKKEVEKKFNVQSISELVPAQKAKIEEEQLKLLKSLGYIK